MYGCTCYYSTNNQTNIFDCRDKNFTSLPDNAPLYTDQLSASGNNFGNIAKVEKYMEDITHLDISNSNVSSITDGVMKSMLKNLKTLNVLEILPQSIIEAKLFTELFISNNSYDCNCDMIWMRDWLVKATNVMDKEEVVCSQWKNDR